MAYLHAKQHMFPSPSFLFGELLCCQSVCRARPCRTPSTGEELNYSGVSEVCLYLLQRQHLLPAAAPPGFSSGPLLLSLRVSVRPEGQQRRSHLDVIKLEMPQKKKKSHIQSVSRTDMWESIFFHALLISSLPSFRVLSFLNSLNSKLIAPLFLPPDFSIFWSYFSGRRGVSCSAD